MLAILITLLAAFSVSAVVDAAATVSGAAACVTGTADSNSTFVIDYTEATVPTTSTTYDLDPTFESTYQVGSIMDLYTTHDANMSDYATFKCQYACNSNQGCVSFFGRFANVSTDYEHFECVSLSSLLDSSSFTTSTSNIANGGFNKLCS